MTTIRAAGLSEQAQDIRKFGMSRRPDWRCRAREERLRPGPGRSAFIQDLSELANALAVPGGAVR
ncbi:MAG: hypothetical protein IPL05_15560 [Betaproteobacteria bacterium]|nr:hypothetical protein [Betaproteobacteria bacterium]